MKSILFRYLLYRVIRFTDRYGSFSGGSLNPKTDQPLPPPLATGNVLAFKIRVECTQRFGWTYYIVAAGGHKSHRWDAMIGLRKYWHGNVYVLYTINKLFISTLGVWVCSTTHYTFSVVYLYTARVFIITAIQISNKHVPVYYLQRRPINTFVYHVRVYILLPAG